MKQTCDAPYDAAGLNPADPAFTVSQENGWLRARDSFLCLTSL